MKKLLLFLLSILSIAILFIVREFLNHYDGVETNFNFLVNFSSFFFTIELLALFFKLKSIDIRDLVNLRITIMSIITSLFIGIMFIKPLFFFFLHYLNTQNSIAIETQTIISKKPYHYSTSKNKPYYMDLIIDSQETNFKISPQVKEDIDSTNIVKSIHKGSLGYYFIENIN